MKIYKIISNDDFKACILSDENYNKIYDKAEFKEKLSIHELNNRKIKFINPKRILGDVAWYWSCYGTLIINQNTKEILEKNLNNIQYIPIKSYDYPTENFYFLNVLNYGDFLNINESTYKKMKNRYGELRIAYIKDYRFNKSVINESIFKITIPKHSYYWNIFVTDNFLKIVNKYNLTGFNFEKIDEIKS